MEAKLVKDIMHKGVISCRPETPLQEVVRVIADTDVHAVVVTDPSGIAKGIISHMDILPYYGKDISSLKAKDVMTPEVISVTPDTPVEEAARLMLERDIHRVVVANNTERGKEPIGVLSTTDIIRDMRGPRWVWYMA
ncbi:MAG TPA: CBS domain-containing protein [Chloroflexi bacterium]|nr:CBS domain-containing protein [Chloroflexota bacterium]